jgi:tRNA-splicing ligase RtcB (3'-phosphate/5'-hydroxy nucleic acid ligase)
MLEYTGKYGKAKVMIDEIDEATISQIYEFLNHEAFTNPIAIMPDTHAGKGAVIGFTMRMTDKIIPNVVGVDIGCGMLSIETDRHIYDNISWKSVDEMIRKVVPFGTAVNTKQRSSFLFDTVSVSQKYVAAVMNYNDRYNTDYRPVIFNGDWFKNKCKEIGMDHERALLSLGTLGGGNHFIEIGISEQTSQYWITVHSGSRQFGLKVANYWQKKAGKGQLAYLEGDDMFGYLTDMFFAQQYADVNRRIMGDAILREVLNTDTYKVIETTHNFIDFTDFIIRKGAISSYENTEMIIPFNMEDGILICEGKSNKEWNYSAPHGAGRVSSRSQAKKVLKPIEEDIKNRMTVEKGIYCSKLPLDEVKEAYKDPKIIEEAIGPTATIIDRLKPVLSMKD